MPLKLQPRFWDIQLKNLLSIPAKQSIGVCVPSPFKGAAQRLVLLSSSPDVSTPS